jgi:hypothetical protein
VIENAVDYTHLPFVHIKWDTVKSEPLEVDGSVLKWRASREGGEFLGSAILFAKPEETLSDITCYGLGCKLIRVHAKVRINVNVLLMFLMTPIDHEYLDVHAVFSIKKIFNPIVTSAVARNIIKQLRREIQQDIPILFLTSVMVMHQSLNIDGGFASSTRNSLSQTNENSHSYTELSMEYKILLKR